MTIKTTQEMVSILQGKQFSKIQTLVLDRTKPAETKRLLDSFRANLLKGIGPFQDSDVILVALTVKHNKS